MHVYIEVYYVKVQIEELEERLNETLHQKQVLALRLDSQLKLAQEEQRFVNNRVNMHTQKRKANIFMIVLSALSLLLCCCIFLC